MNTIASRFLSFEEPLGAGLVKFAYFVIAAVLLILMVIAMIAGIVAMFEVGFFAGLGRFLLAPLQFVLALILLRVATEVVLAILSIDDNLTDGARTEGAMPIPSPKQAMSGGSSLPKSPDTSVTEASKDQNQRAPFTRGADGKDVDTSETEASKEENQAAPFTQGSSTQGSGSSAASSASASSAGASSSGTAKSVSTAPAPEASAKKAPAKKTATKKATKKTANSPASGDADTANATSSESAKKTAEAAKAATRPSASDDKGGAS